MQTTNEITELSGYLILDEIKVSNLKNVHLRKRAINVKEKTQQFYIP